MSQGDTGRSDPAREGSSAAGDAATPRPTPGSEADALLGRVFVSPRVVDQRAFDDMSATLRSLVKDAASQNRMLLGATGDVRGLSEQLRGATRELDERVRDAAATLGAIDERAARADQLIQSAREELGTKLREFKDLLSGAAAIDRSHIEHDVRARITAVLEAESRNRLHAFNGALDAAVDSALARLDAARLAAQAAAANADRAEVRAAAVLERAGSELGRLEEALGRLRDVSILAADKATALAEAAAAAEARLDAARADLDSAAASLTTRLDDALARIGPAIESIESQSDGILARLRAQLAQALAQAASLDVSTAEKAAADLADAVNRATDTALELRELKAGISQQREQAEAATRSFATMAAQSQQAGTEVGNRILAAAEWLDGLEKSVSGLEARARMLIDETRQSAESLRDARAVVNRAEEIGPRLARLVQRADSLAIIPPRAETDGHAPQHPAGN